MRRLLNAPFHHRDVDDIIADELRGGNIIEEEPTIILNRVFPPHELPESIDAIYKHLKKAGLIVEGRRAFPFALTLTVPSPLLLQVGMAASDSVHLPPSQRTRLLKSSRKIEAMLGTTPLVLPDADLPHPRPRLERSRSKSAKGPHWPVPQPVLLRSRSVALPSLAPSSPHVKSPSLDTAASGSGPSTPLSDLFSPIPNDAKEREMRRRKMAKITRTLGENIPPELVFGAIYNSEGRHSSPKNAAGNAHRTGRLTASSSSNSDSRSAEVTTSVDSTYPGAMQDGELTPTAATSSLSLTSSSHSSNDVTQPAAATPTASTFYYHYTKASSHHTLPTGGATTIHRSRSQRTIAGYYPVYHAGPFVSSTPALGAAPLEPSPELSPPFSISSLSSVDSESPLLLQRAASTSSRAPLIQPTAAARSAKSLDVQRSSTFTNFQDLHHETCNETRSPGTRRHKGAQVHTQEEEACPTDEEDAPGGRKKEKEWSGEWNVKDMGDVVKKLRELKGR